MQDCFKADKQEKNITNAHEQFVLKGQSENALNIFIKEMGLENPSIKTYIKCRFN